MQLIPGGNKQRVVGHPTCHSLPTTFNILDVHATCMHVYNSRHTVSFCMEGGKLEYLYLEKIPQSKGENQQQISLYRYIIVTVITSFGHDYCGPNCYFCGSI